MAIVPALDPILHQPVRTRIVAMLLACGEVSFTDLKNSLEITDGNLDAHLKKLSEVGYLHSRFVLEGRPHTLYSLSVSGQKALRRYVDNVKALLKLAPANSDNRSGRRLWAP